jgi:hypothetical protein
MDASMLYFDKPGLLTEEEREDAEFDPSSIVLPVIPPSFHHDYDRARPDAEGREAFERRTPALGFKSRDLDGMAARFESGSVSQSQRRMEFGVLRSAMLSNLIPCSGVKDFAGLLGILRAELASGVPAPVPSWYEYSTVKFGPRRMGYYACDARGCFVTEDAARTFSKCGGCGLPKYCSRECQAADWKARHKFACKKGQKSAKQTEDTAAALERMLARFQGK